MPERKNLKWLEKAAFGGKDPEVRIEAARALMEHYKTIALGREKPGGEREEAGVKLLNICSIFSKDPALENESVRAIIAYYLDVSQNIFRPEDGRIKAALNLVDLHGKNRRLSELNAIVRDKKSFEIGGFHYEVKGAARSEIDSIVADMLNEKTVKESDISNLRWIATRYENDGVRENMGHRLVGFYTGRVQAGELRDIAEYEPDPNDKENKGFVGNVKNAAWINAKRCIMVLVSGTDFATVDRKYSDFISNAPIKKQPKSVPPRLTPVDKLKPLKA